VTAQGLIELQGTTLKITSELLFMFEIAKTDHVVYKLRAENAQDLRTWVEKLARVCKLLGHHLDSDTISQNTAPSDNALPSPAAPLSPTLSRPASMTSMATSDRNSIGRDTTARREQEWSDNTPTGTSTERSAMGREEGVRGSRKVTTLTAGGAQLSPSGEVGWGEGTFSTT
jgi:hypothetical protein